MPLATGAIVVDRRSRRRAVALRGIAIGVLAIVPLAVGCGDGKALVSGKVTFNGEPIARGAITLVPTDGKGQTVGSAIESGAYRIQGVLPGEKTVQIIAVYSLGRRKDEDGSAVEAMGDLLPASWGPTSKERLTVTAPTTTKDFAIEGPDPRKK
jgi:hypothetical protein